jgi:hypothetical protein
MREYMLILQRRDVVHFYASNYFTGLIKEILLQHSHLSIYACMLCTCVCRSLRNALVGEVANATDLLLRQGTRRNVARLESLLRPPAPPLPFLPRLPSIPLPQSIIDALSPPVRTYTCYIYTACAACLHIR